MRSFVARHPVWVVLLVVVLLLVLYNIWNLGSTEPGFGPGPTEP